MLNVYLMDLPEDPLQRTIRSSWNLKFICQKHVLQKKYKLLCLGPNDTTM